MKLFMFLRTQAAEAIITSDTSQADRFLQLTAKWPSDCYGRHEIDLTALSVTFRCCWSCQLNPVFFLCFWKCGRWLVHQEQIWRRSYVVMAGGENHSFVLTFNPVRPGIAMASLVLDAEVLLPGCCGVWQGSFGTPARKEMQFNRHVFGA